jgi:hypothetical protein
VTSPPDAQAASRRAADFVIRHGEPLDRLRAAVLVGDAPLSSLVEACTNRAGLAVLAALDDVRGLGEAPARAACEALGRAQRDDGSWGGEASDSEDDVLHRTGMLAGYLAKSRWSRPRTLAAAGDYLGARWSPDRVRGFDWRPIAAYAHFFANVPHDLADEALQWCGRELERGFRTGVFDAARTARVFVLCDAMALPGARIEPDELVEALVAGVGEDGGFGGGATESRVAGSIDALAGLARLAHPAPGERPATADTLWQAPPSPRRSSC